MFNISGKAGDEWIVKGPVTYFPKVEVEILEKIQATVLKKGQAIHLKATKDTVDSNKKNRKAGEEWSIRVEGMYICGLITFNMWVTLQQE